MSRTPETHRARRLRQDANLPEDKAWQALRTLRKHGYPVRRQHPIGGYFADFCILSERLIIEIDGGVHDTPAAIIADRERKDWLKSQGWHILRIPAETALSADHILAAVTDWLSL